MVCTIRWVAYQAPIPEGSRLEHSSALSAGSAVRGDSPWTLREQKTSGAARALWTYTSWWRRTRTVLHPNPDPSLRSFGADKFLIRALVPSLSTSSLNSLLFSLLLILVLYGYNIGVLF